VRSGVRADEAEVANELIGNSCANCHGKTGKIQARPSRASPGSEKNIWRN